jgi:hypothetical protein
MKEARAASLQKVFARATSAVGAAAVIGSTITANTVVTSVGIAPLSAWLTSGPLLVQIATVFGCMAPPLAVACAVIGAWHLIQMADGRKKYLMWEKEVAHCENRECPNAHGTVALNISRVLTKQNLCKQ